MTDMHFILGAFSMWVRHAKLIKGGWHLDVMVPYGCCFFFEQREIDFHGPPPLPRHLVSHLSDRSVFTLQFCDLLA
jgi:hypothetical protein